MSAIPSQHGGASVQGTGNFRAIDLGVVVSLQTSPASQGNERPAAAEPVWRDYFCSIAGVGLDSEVARLAQALPPWLRGHGGYALSLLSRIFRFAPLPMRILTHDESGWVTCSNQPTILAAFANSSTYGGGMKIAPRAKMDDALLDVCIVSAVDPFKLACLFPTVYFGRHLNIREVTYFQSARVRVETEAPLDVYADGEYVCRTPVELSVKPHALQVIVHPSQTRT